MKNTTIMITKELQRQLKILCAMKGTTYENLIEEMTEIYRNAVPFSSKEEFVEWLKKRDNINSIGFKKVIKSSDKHSCSLLVEDFNGKQRTISVEINARDFIMEKCNPHKIDYIIALFSTKEFIKGIPILSINNFPFQHKKLIPIAVPRELKQKLDRLKAHANEPYRNTIQKLISAYKRFGDGVNG